MGSGEWLALLAGLVLGLTIGWLWRRFVAPGRAAIEGMRLELDDARRRLAEVGGSRNGAEVIHLADRVDRDRLITERNDAVHRAQTSAEAAFQAQHEVQVLNERLQVSERRVAEARRSIHQITARLQVAAARRAPAAVPAAICESPVIEPWESEMARLEGETIRLRRQLADRAVELDRLRNGPETRTLHDPRLRRALDDVAQVWGSKGGT